MRDEEDHRPIDYVNHPVHYRTGPIIKDGNRPGNVRMLEAIEVIRWIRDARLANAVRYIWRVSFGGKWDDPQDIEKAIWYLRDYVENPVNPLDE